MWFCGFGLADSLDCLERGKRNLAVKFKKKTKKTPAHLVTLSDNENVIKKKRSLIVRWRKDWMRVRRTCVDISFSVYLTLDDLRIPSWNLLNVSFDNLSPRNPTHALMTSSFFLFHSFCQNSIGWGTIYAVIWSLYSYFELTLSFPCLTLSSPLCAHLFN